MNSLLNFLKTKTEIDYNVVRETEKNWSSELQASIAFSLQAKTGSGMTEYEYYDNSLELDSRETKKLYLKLTSKQKFFCLLLLRDYSIWSGDWLAKFIYTELVDLSIKKNVIDSGYVLSVISCSDKRFLYTLNEQLQDNRQRQIFSTVYNDKILNTKSKKTWLWLLTSIITSIKITKYCRPEPIKVERHKGYRDHGSLGSEFSRTLRQQSNDFSVLEKEQELQRAHLIKLRQWYHGWGLLD